MNASVQRIVRDEDFRIEVDRRTAEALKVLVGLGTVHFTPSADVVAQRMGFHNMGEVIDRVAIRESLYNALESAGV